MRHEWQANLRLEGLGDNGVDLRHDYGPGLFEDPLHDRLQPPGLHFDVAEVRAKMERNVGLRWLRKSGPVGLRRSGLVSPVEHRHRVGCRRAEALQPGLDKARALGQAHQADFGQECHVLLELVLAVRVSEARRTLSQVDVLPSSTRTISLSSWGGERLRTEWIDRSSVESHSLWKTKTTVVVGRRARS